MEPVERTPARLYLVRHGETEWSLNGQHTGRTDIALTAHGEAEARTLDPALRAIRFDRVFTSPARRARRTCELAGLGAAAEIDPDLQEWDYGAYEGKRSAEIRSLNPGWGVYRDGAPGGESVADVAARADRVIERYLALGGTIAVFSHGHFGCSLGARWIGLPVGMAQHFFLGTASLSILGFNPRHPGVPIIAQWNASPG